MSGPWCRMSEPTELFLFDVETEPAAAPDDAWLLASQEKSRLNREAFQAALAKGATPATWGGVPCPACDQMMLRGDLVVRVPERKGGKVVHERCAP